MTDLTPERREENMRLREAATPGPWQDQQMYCQKPKHVYCREVVSISGGTDHVELIVALLKRGDAAYIVAACNDLPLYEAALVEREREIERLKAELLQSYACPECGDQMRLECYNCGV